MKKHILILSTALVSLISFSQVPNYVPSNGLVGYWPFNGDANDESGNGNNGTVNGATLTTDRFGVANKAYSFDGIDDWVETTNYFLQTNNPHSISIWWKTADSLKTNQTIFNTGPHTLENLAYHYSSSNVNPPFGLSFGIGNGQSGVGSWNVIWPDTGQIVTPYTINNWHLVTWVKDGSYNWKIYFDTSLIYTFYSNLNSGNQTANIRFGAENNGFPTGGANFKGNIDDIGIWNRALTECEIADLYNCQLGSLNSSSTLSVTAIDSYTLNNQTYTQSGTYTQIIPNAAGCDSTITLNLTLSFSGIDELLSSIKLYPNPTTGKITLEGNFIEQTKFSIKDAIGKEVLNGVLINSDINTIDLENIARGSYNLLIDEFEIPFRIIKN